MTPWSLRAHAKINLGLRVVSKRSDGYHELDTHFLQISLADKLIIAPGSRPGLVLTCNWPGLPVDDTNLCARAYALLVRDLDPMPAIEIHLDKHIPQGAGMGGGSSDAAVTLIALNNILHLRRGREHLQHLALQLGSDVPFFLTGGFCHGAGRGEILTPVADLPDIWVLVIAPNLAISTATVFQSLKFGLTNSLENGKFASFRPKTLTFHTIADFCQNDLEPVVFQKYPALAAIKRKLLDCGAKAASMTGSGAAIYGLFGSLEEAQHAQQKLRSEYTTHVARPVKWGIQEIEEFLSSKPSTR